MMNTDALRIAALSILVLAAGFALAYQFVEPAPPTRITLAAGSKSGAYYAFAKRYHQILAREGIELAILETAGSVENIRLLNQAQADVAFVQGGTGDAAATPDLVSLGSLYFEPLWLFVQDDSGIDSVRALAGRTVAAGADGSGTWAVAGQLLADNGVDVEGPGVRRLSSDDAARALIAGDVDAAFFVSSPSSPLIRGLLDAPGLGLVSFARADAYTRRHRHLSAVTLHRGVLDLGRDVPDHDTALLAPAATLAARSGLHPALQTLLVQAAGEIHGAGGLFEEPGQFPSARFVDFPLSDDARRFLEDGPSLLQKYLPFWAAAMLDRLKVMLVPLIALMMPLMKILPPTYRWRIRSRIYTWYGDLTRIEREAETAPDGVARGALLERLAALERDVRRLHVPLSYTDEVYNLRLHIDLVTRRLTSSD
ncbi:MAG: TAXI family TRAP transporter solute-binding subunit [Alphaproteobacteria bacterium]|nr:TAXI family TRAP transporter solute-binding subunit [Alphaproteobacteria bacterium]